jgi:hypothetical protein
MRFARLYGGSARAQMRYSGGIARAPARALQPAMLITLQTEHHRRVDSMTTSSRPIDRQNATVDSGSSSRNDNRARQHPIAATPSHHPRTPDGSCRPRSESERGLISALDGTQLVDPPRRHEGLGGALNSTFACDAKAARSAEAFRPGNRVIRAGTEEPDLRSNHRHVPSAPRPHIGRTCISFTSRQSNEKIRNGLWIVTPSESSTRDSDRIRRR